MPCFSWEAMILIMQSLSIGHIAAECTNDRADYLVDAADMTPEVAWTKLIAADAEKDLDQVREVSLTSTCKQSFLEQIS